jgi:hypothetical protein
MWSKELRELSKTHLQSSGVNVKSVDGDYGILNINRERTIYRVSLLRKSETKDTRTEFHSVDDMIEAGWAVD